MNFILKYSGENHPDLKKMMSCLQAHNGVLVDAGLLPGKALVKLEEPEMKMLQSELAGEWEIYREKSYSIPSPRKKIRKLL